MKKQAALTLRLAVLPANKGIEQLCYGVVYRERPEFWPEWWPWCWTVWRNIGTLVCEEQGPSESVCFAFSKEQAEKILELVQKNGVRFLRHPYHSHLNHWEAIESVTEWEE